MHAFLQHSLELVSKELNHLAAILHIFPKENGDTFTLLIIVLEESLQKEEIAKITQYDP